MGCLPPPATAPCVLPMLVQVAVKVVHPQASRFLAVVSVFVALVVVGSCSAFKFISTSSTSSPGLIQSCRRYSVLWMLTCRHTWKDSMVIAIAVELFVE